MKRVRLRAAYDEYMLDRIYAKPHDHTQWLDHQLRVGLTIEVIRTLSGSVAVAADLSCGDGAVLKGIDAEFRVMGDRAAGWGYTGSIEDTIGQIPDVDLFVCCETVEHLDDPDAVLKKIRGKTKTLVLSTPVDAFNDDNVEHYWAWDREAVEDMLLAAGFTTVVYASLDCRPGNVVSYCWGVWWCR